MCNGLLLDTMTLWRSALCMRSSQGTNARDGGGGHDFFFEDFAEPKP